MTAKSPSKLRRRLALTIRNANWNHAGSPLNQPEFDAIIKTLLDNLTLLADAKDAEKAVFFLLEDKRNLRLREVINGFNATPGKRGPKVKLLSRVIALLLVLAFRDITGSGMQPSQRASLQFVAWRIFGLCHAGADAKAAIEKSLPIAALIRPRN